MRKNLVSLVALVVVFAGGVVISQLLGQIGQMGNQSPAQAGIQSAPQPNTVLQGGASALLTNTPRMAATVKVLMVAQVPTETIPPYTGLPSLTPSRTLRPPPTLEPPTPTLPASATPTITPTPTSEIVVSIPGLRGAETPTPTTTPGCTARKDWKLEYEVKRGDALSRIADQYNISLEDLMAANCLTDKNMIVIGQRLKVPGTAHPAQPEFNCTAYEAITPRNGTLDISGTGTISFVWRGPRVPYTLIRILDSDGNIKLESVVELRQNESIDVTLIPLAGTYTWYLYPLNSVFVQACPEGGPYTFYKDAKPGK